MGDLLIRRLPTHPDVAGAEAVGGKVVTTDDRLARAVPALALALT